MFARRDLGPKPEFPTQAVPRLVDVNKSDLTRFLCLRLIQGACLSDFRLRLTPVAEHAGMIGRKGTRAQYCATDRFRPAPSCRGVALLYLRISVIIFGWTLLEKTSNGAYALNFFWCAYFPGLFVSSPQAFAH